VRLLLIGHLQPWLAIVLWFAVTVTFVLLWRAIQRQARRERAQRQRRLDGHRRWLLDHEDWLREHEARLAGIEKHLLIKPKDDPWNLPASQ
jgi:membrane protein implicated in regulation of membrane protease activity